MNLTLKTAPAAEPVSLAEAKAHLIVEHTADDAYITALITAAREWCEAYQARAYVTQTWEMTLDRFPPGVIELPKGRLQTVNSVSYKDSAGNVTTLAAGTDYVVSTAGIVGRIARAYGKSWPSFVAYPLDPVKIEFTCGYGNAAAVPEKVKQAMKLLISHWYENRLPVETRGLPKETEFAVTALLMQDRIANV